MTVLHRPEREEAVNSMSIGLNDLWSDDVNDDEYNHHVVATDYPYSHEKLRRSDRIYDLIGVTNFNWPVAKLGAGSAIFLHVWRRPRFPTEGCVAFARDDLRWILSNWESGSRIVIAGSSACRK
jgi:L,D-peptidoglycan transpeptidase YkuD (ErfK/YbiS/YcfS/YnhG family)